jgi:hypothetical protein
MHELLTEEELQTVHVLIVLNYARKDFEIANRDEKLNIADVEDNTMDVEVDTRGSALMDEMKKNIYFHLIPQMNKIMYICDIFDEKVSASDHQKTRSFMKQYISMFE